MPGTPLRLSGALVDISPRVQRNSTVVASPAAATETIVASLTVVGDLAVQTGILVIGYGAFTQGTDGTHWNLRLRKTDVSGTILKASGAIALAATVLGAHTIVGFDTAPTLPNQVYVLTATMTLASAASTFSAVEIVAIVL